jgi:hypothetical protein
MIRSMEGFTFASVLRLNMGYYHIKLDQYKYKRLPMGIKIALDVFQNVMSKPVQDMEYVKTSIRS